MAVPRAHYTERKPHPMLTITRKLEFDAGHRIPDHNSQCRNLHGHRYTLLITLTGDVVQQDGESDNGMIMDFGDIKAAFKPLLDQLDHYYLNEIEGLDNPTSENLVKWICKIRKNYC